MKEKPKKEWCYACWNAGKEKSKCLHVYLDKNACEFYEPPVCNICEREGHIAKNCKRCTKCGRYGHLVDDCWKVCSECQSKTHIAANCPMMARRGMRKPQLIDFLQTV
jgi:hypothetical protein